MIRLIQLLSLVTLVLTACSIRSSKEISKNRVLSQWQRHQRAVQHLSQYQTRGTFLYLSNQQKIYAHFFWQQTAKDYYRLLLLNPLGRTELELNARPGEVKITYNEDQNYISDNAEEMIDKFTNMSIPLNSLRKWILGLPDHATDYQVDDQYHLIGLSYNQNGQIWKVVYNGYDTKTTPAMPSSMELSRDEQRIKLKMDNWIVK